MRLTNMFSNHYETLAGDANKTDSPLKKALKERPEILLSNALDMARWNDPDLVRTIEELESSSRSHGVDMGLLLTQRRRDGSLPIEDLMRTKNHRILLILHRNINSGWVVPGLMRRDADSLLLRASESSAFWGF